MTTEHLPALLPYQLAWVNDRSTVKVCVKSRRIGISWATALEAVELSALRRDQGGMNVYYQVYAGEDTKGFIDDCARWARGINLLCNMQTREVTGDEAEENYVLADGDKSVLVHSLEMQSGFGIYGLSHSPRKLRNKSGLYILDEAAYHDDVRGALEAAGAFRVWGGRVAVISTQDEVDNEFNELVQDVKAERGARASYSLHEIPLPEAVAQGLYKRICYVRGEPWSPEREHAWVEELLASEGAEAEYLCIPRKSGGTYIPRAVVEPCMTDEYPVVRFHAEDGFLTKDEAARNRIIDRWCADVLGPLLARLPKGRAHYLGEDFGRSSDLTVLAPGYEQQDMTLEVPFLVELANVPYESQKRVVFYVLERLPRLTRAVFDATGNGGYLAEQALAHWGETIVEAVAMNIPWYGEALPKLRARFQDSAIRVPRDLDVVQDLAKFQVIDGVPRLPKLRVNTKVRGVTRHGDAGVALACLAYAVASTPAVHYGYQRVPKRAGHFASKGLL